MSGEDKCLEPCLLSWFDEGLYSSWDGSDYIILKYYAVSHPAHLHSIAISPSCSADLGNWFSGVFFKSTETFATFRLHMASISDSSNHWEGSDYHNVNKK